ncbi:DUF4387 domain-containing protein [Myxococcota bacterium]|nr:DUF4387 domain-containing protein [Myxococcota bacterium]
MRRPITELARVIRSKNSGPFELTLDILFREEANYETIRDTRQVTPELIAGIYGVPLEDILSVVYFDPAMAVKATFRRPIPSGVPGDSDIYGAQQHAPLLRLEFDV